MYGVNITIYFENVHFIHAKLGLFVCLTVDKQPLETCPFTRVNLTSHHQAFVCPQEF